METLGEILDFLIAAPGASLEFVMIGMAIIVGFLLYLPVLLFGALIHLVGPMPAAVIMLVMLGALFTFCRLRRQKRIAAEDANG